MACCLTAPSHYLNQCWLIIRGVLWHTSESSFAGIAQGIDSGYEFEKDILKNIFKSPRGQWVNCTKGQPRVQLSNTSREWFIVKYHNLMSYFIMYAEFNGIGSSCSRAMSCSSQFVSCWLYSPDDTSRAAYSLLRLQWRYRFRCCSIVIYREWYSNFNGWKLKITREY